MGLSESPQFGDSAKEGRPLHAEGGAHQGVILPSAKGEGPAHRPEGQGWALGSEEGPQAVPLPSPIPGALS